MPSSLRSWGASSEHPTCGDIPLLGTRSSLARPLGTAGIGARPSQGCALRGVSVSAWREGGLRMLHGLPPLSLSPQPAALGSARPDPPSRPLPPDPVPKVMSGQGGGRPPAHPGSAACLAALQLSGTCVTRLSPDPSSPAGRWFPLSPACPPLSHCPSLSAQAPPSDRPPPPTRPLPADPVLLSAQVMQQHLRVGLEADSHPPRAHRGVSPSPSSDPPMALQPPGPAKPPPPQRPLPSDPPGPSVSRSETPPGHPYVTVIPAR